VSSDSSTVNGKSTGKAVLPKNFCVVDTEGSADGDVTDTVGECDTSTAVVGA
jgi:hypothetical protein